MNRAKEMTGSPDTADSRDRQEYNRMMDLVRVSFEGIAVLDGKGVVLFANPAAESLLGKPPGGAVGYHLGIPAGGSEPAEILLKRGKTDTAIVEMSAVETVWDGKSVFVINLRDITSRKKAFDQAQLLAAIVESTEDAVISKTLSGIITSWNPGAERMYGYSAAEVIGQHIKILVPYGEENELDEIFRRIGKGESVDSYETVRCTKDGRHIFVSLTVSPIQSESGTIIGASAIARDITEKRKAAMELEKALMRVDNLNKLLHTIRRINLLIAKVKNPAVLISKACEILIAGKSFEAAWIVLEDVGEGRLFAHAGINETASLELSALLNAGQLPPCCRELQHLQQPFTEVNTGERCSSCPVSETCPKGVSFSTTLRYEDRCFGYLNAYLSKDFVNHREVFSLFQEINEDITFALCSIDNEKARRLAERQLRKSEETLDQISEMAMVGGWEIDLATDTVEWTRITKMIHEVPDDYTPTLDQAREFFPAEGRHKFLEAIRLAREEGVPFDLELPFITSTGRTLWTRAVGRPEFQDDKCIRLHGMLQDITGLKQALDERLTIEKQFQQAQRLESVGKLAGGVAHDFNNMLSVILGYGGELLDQLHQGDPLRECVEEILSAGKRSAELTRQLLAFSRKQTLKIEVLDLNYVVTNLEKMLRRLIGEDVGLVTKLADCLQLVEADSGQIEQVIMNLAVNARDAMPRGGHLIIETANVVLDQYYCQKHEGAEPGEYVQLTMTDTGCGMDEAVKTRLFEPFFTTKEIGKGTGLGLATVYGIIKQSRGNIWVYSEPGKGSTFKLYLPATNAAPKATTLNKEERKTKGRGELILVIEDEPSLRKLCATILKNAKYRVASAANAGEALLLVEENNLRPDMIVTDVVMPGMSGKVVVDRLKKLLPDIRVLFMSGYTENAIVHHGVLDSGIPFIEKPFRARELESKIRSILDGS